MCVNVCVCVFMCARAVHVPTKAGDVRSLQREFWAVWSHLVGVPEIHSLAAAATLVFRSFVETWFLSRVLPIPELVL